MSLRSVLRKCLGDKNRLTAAEEADDQPEQCSSHAHCPALAWVDNVGCLVDICQIAHRQRLQDVEHRQDCSQEDPVSRYRAFMQ